MCYHLHVVHSSQSFLLPFFDIDVDRLQCLYLARLAACVNPDVYALRNLYWLVNLVVSAK